MRTIGIGLAFLVLTGALVMSDVQADDKKDKPNPDKKESYTEKVTVREWIGKDKLGDPREGVPALRTQISGKDVIWIAPKPGIKTPKGSEITDKDGTVWVVTQSKRSEVNFIHYLNYVTKKP